MSVEDERPQRSRARGLLKTLAVDRAPLKVSPDFRRIFWTELVSQAGFQVTVVAIFIQVQRLTGSTAKVGLIGLVQVVALVLAAGFGGPLIDRLDRRRIFIVTQLAFVGVSVVLLYGAMLERAPLWLIYVAAAVNAGLSGIASPTRGAIVPNLIPRALLSSAIALNQVKWNAAMVVGPAIGGVIIGRAGLEWAYGLDAVTYAATIYAGVRLPAMKPHHDGEQPSIGWKAIKESAAFVKRTRLLQATFVVDLFAMIFGMPRALFPVLAAQRFQAGPEIVGSFFSAIAAGAVIGAMTAGWVSRVRRHGLATLVAVAVWGSCIVLFGLTSKLWLAFVLLAVAGTSDVISAVFRGTILQTVVADSVRGRMNAIHILVVTGGPRLGDLEAGLVAAAFTPVVSVVSGGLACIAGVALMFVMYPEFVRYRAPADDEAPGPPGSGLTVPPGAP